MNDQNLIFEAYLNENRYRAQGEMMKGTLGKGETMYGREAATGFTGGKGNQMMPPEEEARILNSKYSNKINDDLKNGDIIDVTQILGDNKKKEIEKLISMMSDGDLTKSNQLNVYPDEGVGLIPKFKIQNIIQFLNYFTFPEKKYNTTLTEIKNALIGIDDGTREYYSSLPQRVTPKGERVTRHTGDTTTFAQRIKGKEGSKGTKAALAGVRKGNPERGGEMSTYMPDRPIAEEPPRERMAPSIRLTAGSIEPKKSKEGKTFDELKKQKGKAKTKKSKTKPTTKKPAKVAKESFIRDDIPF
jgi:hypothetical protein